MYIFFQKRGIVAALSITLVFFALPVRAEELTPPAPDYLATEILTPELPEAFIYQYRKPRITRVVDTPNPAVFQCVYLHPCLI